MESTEKLKEVSALYEEMLLKKERKNERKWRILKCVYAIRALFRLALIALCVFGIKCCTEHIKNIYSTCSMMVVKQNIPVQEGKAGDTMYVTCKAIDEFLPNEEMAEGFFIDLLDPEKFKVYRDVSFEPKTEGLYLVNETWPGEYGTLKIGETAQARYSYTLTEEDVSKGFVETEVWIHNYYDESEQESKELKIIAFAVLAVLLFAMGVYLFLKFPMPDTVKEHIDKEKQEIAAWKHSGAIIEYHAQKQYFAIQSVKEDLKFSYEEFLKAGRMMMNVICESSSTPFLLSIYGEDGPELSMKKSKEHPYSAKAYQEMSLKVEFLKISLFGDFGWTFLVPYWDNEDDWEAVLTELTGSIVRNILTDVLEKAVKMRVPIADNSATADLLKGKDLSCFFIKKHGHFPQAGQDSPVPEDIGRALGNIEHVMRDTLPYKDSSHNIEIVDTALSVF